MELEELGTREKKTLGQGIEHRIFSSPNKPNVVFKVGEWDVINEWYEVFKSDPTIFPIVYRLGRVPKFSDVFYVELEKLNTEKFEDEWDDLELALEDIGAVDVDRGESFTDLYTLEGSSSKKFIEIGKLLQKHDKVAYDFFVNLLKVIKKSEKAQNKILKKDTLVDAHKYNFGYSQDGKLKCLDI
jgi:hypothetical protein